MKPPRAQSLLPKRSDEPRIMNDTVPRQKSMRFFIMIFPAFFALVKPASTIAKPACIQNTNAAPTRNQTPNTIVLTSSIIIPPFNTLGRRAKMLRAATALFIVVEVIR